ncbi:hypothetical protein Dimus_036247, partial [Dionaea muscipula]
EDVIRSKIMRERWMNENGLSNVMEIIKRQKWENLFKRRELVNIDVVKEFYAKMTVIHLKKKDIVKSKVRGIEIEFDHEKLATITGGRSEKRKKKEIRMTLVGKLSLMRQRVEGNRARMINFMMLEWR